MVQAGLDDKLFADLKAHGLGTVMAITSHRGSAFAQKPPHYPTMTALVDELEQASTLSNLEG